MEEEVEAVLIQALIQLQDKTEKAVEAEVVPTKTLTHGVMELKVETV